MPRRTVASLCLAGTVILGAAVAPVRAAHAVAKMVTVNGDGYIIQYPSTWKRATMAMSDMFSTASLKHLARTASVATTADTKGVVAVIVVHGVTKIATIKSVESAMLRDNTKLTSPLTYNSTAQNGITFTNANAEATTDQGKAFGEYVSSTVYHGKTFYFMAGILQDKTAKAKADATEVLDVLGTVALR